MVTSLTLSIIIILQVHRVANSPLRIKRSPRDIAPTLLVTRLHNTGSQAIPVFAHHTGNVPQHLYINKQNANNMLVPSIPLYFHSGLHVIQRPNVIQSSIQHVTKGHVKFPVISHHSVSHSSPNANVTHSTSVIPVFIPIHGLIHDLSVVPLHQQKISHYRAMEKKQEDDEPSNQYRNFYGGHGTGLFFGGQGAGHGFYAYGK